MVTKSNVIAVKCAKCCEYNDQSTNTGPGVIQRKCITIQYPNCTGPSTNGKCPTCYSIIIRPPDTKFNFPYARILVAGINKGWDFDPNASTTIHSETEFEKGIEFIPLDNDFIGVDLTTEELNLLND